MQCRAAPRAEYGPYRARTAAQEMLAARVQLEVQTSISIIELCADLGQLEQAGSGVGVGLGLELGVGLGLGLGLGLGVGLGLELGQHRPRPARAGTVQPLGVLALSPQGLCCTWQRQHSTAEPPRAHGSDSVSTRVASIATPIHGLNGLWPIAACPAQIPARDVLATVPPLRCRVRVRVRVKG